MTLLSVIQEVSAVIGLEVPTGVFTSTEREHIELVSLASEMTERISLAHEWQKLQKIYSILGTGAQLKFSLPNDYVRMLKDSKLWTSSLQTNLTPIYSRDKWLELDVQAFDIIINAWIIYEDALHFKPTLADQQSVEFFYQANNYIEGGNGAQRSFYASDNDIFILGERLLRLGMIWQWKANKGFAYAEDMANYEDALSKAIDSDKGSRILRVGRKRIPSDVKTAYPMVIVP